MLSFWYYCTQSQKAAVAGDAVFQLVSNGSVVASATINGSSLVAGAWTRVTIPYTFTTAAIPSTALAAVLTFTNGGNIFFSHVKLEVGAEATDWCAALEDADGAIASVRTAVQEITDNYISNTV